MNNAIPQKRKKAAGTLPLLALLFLLASTANFAALARTVTISGDRVTITAADVGPDDDLIITAKVAGINGGQVVHVRSITVTQGSRFDNVGTLHVSGSPGNGIENHGNFLNRNTLIISNSAKNGIYNTGSFAQNNGCKILQSGENGIVNKGENAEFWISGFEGSMIIDGTGLLNSYGSGIDNSNKARFNDDGGLLIQNVADDGIYNHSGASFMQGGYLHILNTGTKRENGEGILNTNPGTTFTNYGFLTIENTADEGIQNENALFENRGRRFSIKNAGTASADAKGIFNIGPNAKFTNNTKIEIDGTSDDGIENRGGAQFENLGEAKITVKNTGTKSEFAEGIFNHGQGTGFLNEGSLEIAGNIGDDGIYNHNGAQFHNSGGISIAGTGSVSKTGDGISNTRNAQFSNTGQLTLTHISDDGIQNDNGGLFYNHASGKIEISGTGRNNPEADGLHNAGGSEFYNAGQIEMPRSIGDDGIDNKALFANSGTLNIQSTGGNNPFGDGIHNHESGSFTNTGSIAIGGSIGDDGIYNQSGASFENKASISIANTGTNTKSGDGIINTNAGTLFANTGIITLVQAIGDEGLQNEDNASFDNQGTLHIANTGTTGGEGNGIFNISGASLQNSGTISLLEGVQAEGILNQAEITNSQCAEIASAFRIHNTGQLLNLGLMRLSFEGGQTNEGTFVNKGVIEDSHGSLQHTSYDNLQIVAAPETGEAQLFSQPLQLGKSVGWKISEKWVGENRQAIGAFALPTNELRHQLPEGEQAVWFEVSNPESGCSRQIAQTLYINAKSDAAATAEILEKSGTLSLQMQPNPASEQTTITFATHQPETGSQRSTLTVYDMTGKKVKTLHRGKTPAGSPQSVIFDTSKLPAGIYLVELSSANGEKLTKRLVIAR